MNLARYITPTGIKARFLKTKITTNLINYPYFLNLNWKTAAFINYFRAEIIVNIIDINKPKKLFGFKIIELDEINYIEYFRYLLIIFLKEFIN